MDNESNNMTQNKKANMLSEYEKFCQQQIEQMEEDMEGRCYGEMAEGQFVRSHYIVSKVICILHIVICTYLI